MTLFSLIQHYYLGIIMIYFLISLFIYNQEEYWFFVSSKL